MNIQQTNHDGVVVLAPSGRIDTTTSGAVDDTVRRSVDSGARSLVIDFSGVDYISSAGLRVLMLAAKQARAQNGYLAVAAVQPLVQEILEISKFTLVLRVLPSVREAVAAASATGLAAFERG